MKIAFIILTYNEEMHIKRCLESIKPYANEIYLIDSFSEDQTVEIAKLYDVEILQNKFVNQSEQLNWALSNINPSSEWIFRIDADEYLPSNYSLDKDLIISNISSVNGIYVKRNMVFQGKKIRFGGVFPIYVLRLFRFGFGVGESRWMDEHIIVSDGKTIKSNINIVDENLNSLDFWISKHNNYSSREAVEILNDEFHFISRNKDAHKNPGIRTFIKNKFYLITPLYIRSTILFFVRYIIFLGFLDGIKGFLFHFLQAYWYRLLVDAKVLEVKSFMKKNNVDVKQAIKECLHLEL